MTIISAREFNQDVSAAKRAATQSRVYITDRGRTSHVLLTVEDYQQLAGGRRSLAEALSLDSPDTSDFEPARLNFTSHIPEL